MVPLVGGVIWILAVAQHMGGGITYAKFTKKMMKTNRHFFGFYKADATILKYSLLRT